MQNNIPTYRYDYHGNYTNISPVPWLDAYHGSGSETNHIG